MTDPLFDPISKLALSRLTMDEIEKRILRRVIHIHGSKRKAAKQLGYSLKTVYNKLAKYAEDAA